MKSPKIRYTVQIFFLVLVLIFAVNHMAQEKGWNALKILPFNANLHALCPLGGVETLYTMVTNDTLVKKVHTSSIVLMWGSLLLAVILGAAFCGWLCPFGTIQEFLGRLGKKLFGKRYNRFIPAKVGHYLQYLRFVLLAIILWQTAETGKLFFGSWDPYHTLFAIASSEITITALIILAVTLLASLFEERAWCKFACPLGAINGLFNKVSLFKIRRNAAQCIDCANCSRQCPMKIDVAQREKITSTICLRCGRCLSACPAKSDTLEYQIGKYSEVK